MIKVNGLEIAQNHFPDNSLLIKLDRIPKTNTPIIEWHYESDSELFTLICIAKHFQCPGILKMPYCPHARMDRVKDESDVFTLKYFIEIINSLNFSKVQVLDPHSNVCMALLNNVEALSPVGYIHDALSHIVYLEEHDCSHEARMATYKNLINFFPDEGAMKRYSDMTELQYAFGIKKRDWKTGQIQGLDIMNAELVKDKNILIIDDICSKGGTFYHSAKALKTAGANHIYLFVTHCEKSIFQGEVFESGLIDHVFTTDSIFKKEWETDKITIV